MLASNTVVSFLHLPGMFLFLFYFNVCQLLAMKIRRRCHSKCANVQSVSIKRFEKFEKQFCTLWHATRNNDRDLTGANVPFEGTHLSLIARSWMRGSTRVSRVKRTERIFHETTPRNYPVLRRASLEISSVRLRPRRIHFVRYNCHVVTRRGVHWWNHLKAPFTIVTRNYFDGNEAVHFGSRPIVGHLTNSGTELINVS